MEITAVVGVLVTAAVLGITHGIEPDHVAGISALTHEAGSARVSAVVGACFAIGHIVLVALWVAVAYVLLDTRSFPHTLETVGLVVVGVVLALLGGMLGVTGTRKLLHKHGHSHPGDEYHAHYHVHVPAPVRKLNVFTADEHAHEHTVTEYLKIGVLGALFTLSPPISMIAFLSVFLPSSNDALMVPVVATYGIAITVTMTLIGGGAGKLFQFTRVRDESIHAVSQISAAALISLFGGYILWQNLPQLLL